MLRILLTIIYINVVLFVGGCSVQNAYDLNNVENFVESIHTYSQQDVIEYENDAILFTRDAVPLLSSNGETIEISNEILQGNWNYGILNYPLLLLFNDTTQVIDLERNKELFNIDVIKKELDNHPLLNDLPVSYNDFIKITMAEFCPTKDRVAFIGESKQINGTPMSVIGVYNISSEQMVITNISEGSFNHSKYSGDVGPFWGPDGCDFVYTLGSKGDTARVLYVDCHKTGNLLKLTGELLQNHLEFCEEKFHFPNFSDLKWLKEGKKIIFTTRKNDNSEELQDWIVDVYTGDIELLD